MKYHTAPRPLYAAMKRDRWVRIGVGVIVSLVGAGLLWLFF